MNFFKILSVFLIVLISIGAIQSYFANPREDLETKADSLTLFGNETLAINDDNDDELQRLKRSPRSKTNKRRKLSANDNDNTTSAPRLIEKPEMAFCEPELFSVKFERNHFEMIWPIGTRVKRCGGCCLDRHYECQPTQTRTRFFIISVSHYIKGTKFSTPKKEFREIEEHVKCSCQCRKKAKDCTSAQVYDRKNCQCICPNDRDYKKCVREGQNKYKWNYDTCICEVPDDY